MTAVDAIHNVALLLIESEAQLKAARELNNKGLRSTLVLVAELDKARERIAAYEGWRQCLEWHKKVGNCGPCNTALAAIPENESLREQLNIAIANKENAEQRASAEHLRVYREELAKLPSRIDELEHELKARAELIWLRELTWTGYANAVDDLFRGLRIKLPPRPPTVAIRKLETK